MPLNLISGFSREQLSELLAQYDDNETSHAIWVEKNGNILVTLSGVS